MWDVDWLGLVYAFSANVSWCRHRSSHAQQYYLAVKIHHLWLLQSLYLFYEMSPEFRSEGVWLKCPSESWALHSSSFSVERLWSLYPSPCTAKRRSSEEDWLQDKNLGNGLRLCPFSRIIVTGSPWSTWPSQSWGLVQKQWHGWALSRGGVLCPTRKFFIISIIFMSVLCEF